MKVLHVSCVRKLSEGQRKQLSYEYEAAKRLHDVNWDVVVLTCEDPSSEFEKKIPLLFRSIFLRTLYAWIFMLQKRNIYKFILCRHMVFDVFSIFFAAFIRNRITVHHSKEVEELLLIRQGYIGKVASCLENVLGNFALRLSFGIVGVTEEITKYELSRIGSFKPSFVYPNGILVDRLGVLEDRRHPDIVNAAFICGKFSSWHGLELLISSAMENIESAQPYKIKVHLIGGLLESQLDCIRSNSDLKQIFSIYGHLDLDRYKTILEACDVGLASFSLNEKGLSQASTLKVREYLALGLPVYSGHHDMYVENEMGYYVKGDAKIASIIEFATRAKSIQRETIRLSMKEFIDKQKIMERTVNWLSTFDCR